MYGDSVGTSSRLIRNRPASADDKRLSTMNESLSLIDPQPPFLPPSENPNDPRMPVTPPPEQETPPDVPEKPLPTNEPELPDRPDPEMPDNTESDT